MTQPTNPELDLAISRIIKAPRTAVWGAWSDPARFAKWWVPTPAICKVVAMEFRPGGGFATEIDETGSGFAPHMNACFLAVEEGERIVFTDALTGGWRPAAQPFMTATITFRDHPQGTEYAAHVMHNSGADRKTHEEMGFFDGWGTVMRQLAELVEQKA